MDYSRKLPCNISNDPLLFSVLTEDLGPEEESAAGLSRPGRHALSLKALGVGR